MSVYRVSYRIINSWKLTDIDKDPDEFFQIVLDGMDICQIWDKEWLIYYDDEKEKLDKILFRKFDEICKHRKDHEILNLRLCVSSIPKDGFIPHTDENDAEIIQWLGKHGIISPQRESRSMGL
jgi:hypothetical protein